MSGARSVAAPAAGLAAFYGAVAAVVYVVGRWVPALSDAVAPQRAVPVAPEQLSRALQGGEAVIVPTWSAVLIAILGALVFALPVAWTYTVTKRDEGYETSVVQMIVMLPVAVSAVVMVVFGKLSLAFALAGIVAAVRFRTTLKDVKDGVFAFVAIGIGLAAGIQSLFLAGMLSLVFSALALALWKFGVGERLGAPAPTGPVSLGEALVPGGGGVRRGAAELLAPLSAAEWRALRPLGAHVAAAVRSDGERAEGKFRQAIMVFVESLERGRSRTEATLERRASRWTLVETAPGRLGTTVLLYLARLEKNVDLQAFAAELEENDAVRAVEVRPLKEFRRWLG